MTDAANNAPGPSPASAIAATSDYDVLIAGAGLVGLALAPALAGGGLSVAVADRAPIVAAPGVTDDNDWDSRVYAISPGSARFLRSIGAWQAVPEDRVAPIESMHVQGDAGATLGFSSYEMGERALAWIVEERALRAALVPLLHNQGIDTFAPCNFKSLAWSAAHGELHTSDGPQLRARLIVAADGLRSWVRETAGIVAAPQSYGQTGVVANFACEKAHHGRAYQWFLKDGSVLAWLPLPRRRMSIVWSAPDLLAGELMSLDPAALSERVAAAGDYALGALSNITPATGFPLYFMRVRTTVGRRLALVGDAAHGLHPLAGQGVNLGFGDAAALTAILRDRGPVGDPGARLLLERYARQRVEPVLAMQAVTHGLVHLFHAGAGWLSRPRNLGLAAVNRLPLAKRLLARSALR